MKDMDLSREISYALRHAPWEYELEMDEEGWVSVEQLLDALNKDEKWESISEKDLPIIEATARGIIETRTETEE